MEESLIALSLLSQAWGEWRQISFLKSGIYQNEYSPESLLLQLLALFSRTVWFAEQFGSQTLSFTVTPQSTPNSSSQSLNSNQRSSSLFYSIGLALFFLNMISQLYKIKLLSKFQTKSFASPFSMTKVGAVALLVVLIQGGFNLRGLMTKIALFTFVLEIAAYPPQIYHSRNFVETSHRKSLAHTPFMFFAIVTRFPAWIITHFERNTSLTLYHVIVDVIHLYFLKDFLIPYAIKQRNRERIVFQNFSQEYPFQDHHQPKGGCCGGQHGEQLDFDENTNDSIDNDQIHNHTHSHAHHKHD